jgi:hypothetical protein
MGPIGDWFLLGLDGDRDKEHLACARVWPPYGTEFFIEPQHCLVSHVNLRDDDGGFVGRKNELSEGSLLETPPDVLTSTIRDYAEGKDRWSIEFRIDPEHDDPDDPLVVVDGDDDLGQLRLLVETVGRRLDDLLGLPRPLLPPVRTGELTDLLTVRRTVKTDAYVLRRPPHARMSSWLGGRTLGDRDLDGGDGGGSGQLIQDPQAGWGHVPQAKAFLGILGCHQFLRR